MFEVKIADWTVGPALDTAFFQPPDQAAEWENGLATMKPPIGIYILVPGAPRLVSGKTTVFVRIVVAIDGKLRDVRATSARNPDFDETALESVSQWKFKPATCDGDPMEVHTLVEITFRGPRG